VPVLTLMVFPSGFRPNSYIGNVAGEQQRFVEEIESVPDFRERLLTDIAVNQALEGAGALSATAVGPYFVRASRNAFRRATSFFGIPPMAARMMLRLRPRGWHIDELRETRGLPPVDTKRS
jgi:hypothetical protein